MAPRTKPQAAETASPDIDPQLAQLQQTVQVLNQQLQQARAQLTETQAYAYRKQMQLEQTVQQQEQLLNQITQVTGFQGGSPGELIQHLQQIVT